MLYSLREETEGKPQMLLSLRKNGLTSLFKEVRVFKEGSGEGGVGTDEGTGKSMRMRLSKLPLPAIQSETWLVHAKVREPHLNPPVRMNFLPPALVFKGKARKVHTNRGVQMWFTNFRVNQPCFRLDCRETY